MEKRILILGAGEVGANLALSLSRNRDIMVTVVDRNKALCADLAEKADVATVAGDVLRPSVLERAGAHEMETVIAVTDNEAVNLVACRLARAIFHTPTTVARLETDELLEFADELFGRDGAGIVDLAISPEREVVQAIMRLVMTPGAFEVQYLADGLLALIGVRLNVGAYILGHALRDLPALLGELPFTVVAVFRGAEIEMPTGRTVLQDDDEVYFICPVDQLPRAMGLMGKPEHAARSVLIAGGGQVGAKLAQQCREQGVRVTLVELDEERARAILDASEEDFTVVMGSVLDEKLLAEEAHGKDLFISVTDRDEINIFSALLGKRSGIRKTVALVNNATYMHLARQMGVDVPLSPRLITVSQILLLMREGLIAASVTLRERAELLEGVISSGSSLEGVNIAALPVPKGTVVGGIVRAGISIPVTGATTLQADDHLLIVTSTKNVAKVTELFRLEGGDLW